MKKIFIGGSNEAYDRAEDIAACLESMSGVQPLLWKDLFENGDITLVRIEELSKEIDGAIIVATPDDKSVIRKNEARVPRANVVFEYGFLTSRLGRRRVALCVYSPTELPSDFKGLTHVSMGEYESSLKLNSQIKNKLREWADKLPIIQDGIAPTSLIHGYSGRWRFQFEYTLWRNLRVKAPNLAYLEHDDVVLYVPESEKSPRVLPGCGSAHGTLRVQIKKGDCSAEFLRSDRFTEILLRKDGSLLIKGDVISRQINRITGTPPQTDGFEPLLQGSRRYNLILSPTDEPGIMTGVAETTAHNRLISSALVRAQKLD